MLVDKFKLSFVIKLIFGLGLLVTYNSIQITLVKNQFDVTLENEIEKLGTTAQNKPKIWITGPNVRRFLSLESKV